jgi:hypothetical protein
MANIKISELQPAGSELFQDSESFLQELNDREMDVFGGNFSGFESVVSANSGTVYSVNTIKTVSVVSEGESIFTKVKKY